MIELCDDCDFTILIADVISTLMVYDKDNIPFVLRIWVSGSELPFEFESSYYFCFLQEGIRVETKDKIEYLFYDVINQIEVIK